MSHSPVCQRIPRSHQTVSPSSDSARSDSQKSHPTSDQSAIPRVLQQAFFGAQTPRQVEACDRPERPQPISPGVSVQDGDTRVDQGRPYRRTTG